MGIFEKKGLLDKKLRKEMRDCKDDRTMLQLLETASNALDDDTLDLVSGGAQYEMNEQSLEEYLGNNGLSPEVVDAIQQLMKSAGDLPGSDAPIDSDQQNPAGDLNGADDTSNLLGQDNPQFDVNNGHSFGNPNEDNDPFRTEKPEYTDITIDAGDGFDLKRLFSESGKNNH